MKKNVFCPCKINLFLDIEGKREDGYHNLSTLFLECAFGDEIIIEEKLQSSQETRFAVTGPYAKEVPTNESNLFLAAIAAYEQAVSKAQLSEFLSHLRFKLTKNIPPQSGLGAGSSNAAAALKLINEWNHINSLPVSELEKLAASIGSDCSFFINGGAQLAKGRGELLKPLSIFRRPSIVVLVPKQKVSTPQAFANLNPKLDFGPKSQVVELLAWMNGANEKTLADIHLQNAFQRSVCERFSDVKETLEILESFNPAHALLSGSGAACFALFEGIIPDAIKNTMEELQADSWFRLASWDEFTP
ncbi:MAG: 4-(cytidine 5'-diphospho)-2-C-methyl-D-erythritol kinase [Sumerlaeia bacterium]